MGRKKIAIKKIEDLTKRYVAFSKRKNGLFKKAGTACSMYHGSQIAIIVFSPTIGKLHTFGPVDSLIHQFLHSSSSLNPPPPPPPHLNSITTDTDEVKKISRSKDDRVSMMPEERETKKKRKLLMSTTTTTNEAAATTEQEEEEEEEEEEEKEGFLLIKNSEIEEDEGLMLNNEFLMYLENNVIEQLRTTEELLARLEQGSSYREEATVPADPSPSVATTTLSASELKEEDDELKEFLNGVADEIITGHHYYEKNWATTTIDDWDQLLIS